MPGRFTLFAKRVLIFLNVITVIVFLLSCLAPYLDPTEWWFLSLLGLGFPVFFALVILFFFMWLFSRPRYIFISLIALLLGWKSISVFIALDDSEAITYNKPDDVLRVAHWNVARFVEWTRNNNLGSRKRLEMMYQIRQQNADVLCLQEFFQSTDPKFYNNISYIHNKLKYRYHYYSWSPDGALQWIGQIIFSKYPIVGHGIISYPKPSLPETLIYADILFKGDTVRFYTTHLQSVQFKKKDYKSIEEIKNREDSILQNSRNIFSKLKRAVIIRSQQAQIVEKEIAKSTYPTILTGDFNDVPNSYTYFTIKNGMQDLFLQKGFGIGRTFAGISPTLRIDYIMASDHFTVQKFDRVVKNLSDHYMLVADLKLTE